MRHVTARSHALVASFLLALVTVPLHVHAQFPAQPGGYAPYNGGYQQPPAPLNSLPEARIAQLPNASTPGTLTAPAASTAEAGEPAAAESAAASATIPLGNLLGAIRQGGLLMLPIILCSFTLTVFVFERLIFLRRSRVIPKPFVRGVIEQLEQQQLDREEALELCEENGSPMAQLFVASLKKWGRPAVEVEQAVVDAGERVISQLRKYLRLFSAISNLTPLLGLLGTVLGMIQAFNAVAQGDAMGRPELLAGGIGQALLTTAAGLCVAIPAYAAYAYFLGRTDKLILEMDENAQRVIELISAEGLQESGRSRGRSRARAA
jgi:biopolymer transport protein ExbB